MYSVHASRLFMSFHLAVYIYIFFMTEDQLMIMQFITNLLDEKGQTANTKTKTEFGHGLCSTLSALTLKFRLMFHHVSIIIVKLFSPHRSYHVAFHELDTRQVKNMLLRHTLHCMHHVAAHKKQLHTQTSHRVLLLEFLETMQSIREKSSIVNTIVMKTCFTKENAA